MKQAVRFSQVSSDSSAGQRGSQEFQRESLNRFNHLTIQHFNVPSCAFTVIELVGLLAIIAIIASALAPNIIKRIDRAAWQREIADLNAMGTGLKQTILQDRRVPDQSGIAPAISKYLDLSVGQVTATPRGLADACLLIPALASIT